LHHKRIKWTRNNLNKQFFYSLIYWECYF
jgi:hypothetical protein